MSAFLEKLKQFDPYTIARWEYTARTCRTTLDPKIYRQFSRRSGEPRVCDEHARTPFKKAENIRLSFPSLLLTAVAVACGKYTSSIPKRSCSSTLHEKSEYPTIEIYDTSMFYISSTSHRESLVSLGSHVVEAW